MSFVCVVDQESALYPPLYSPSPRHLWEGQTPWFFMFSLLLRNARRSMWGMTGGMELCVASWERVNMKTILSATCVDFGRLQYFFLIFHFSFSPFFPVTVLVLFWSFVHTLLCILFFFLLWFIPFFFNLTFWFSFLPILLGKTHRMCLSFCFVLFISFLPPFLFLSPNFFLFTALEHGR